MNTLIRHAEIPSVGIRDVRCKKGQIVSISEALVPEDGERVFDAGYGALVPGLNDHHIHLYATAAARASVDCSPSVVFSREGLEAALAGCKGEGWIRGFGFHENSYPDLDRKELDRIEPNRPIRIQHQSGMLWILNSAALDLLELHDDLELPSGARRDTDGALNGLFFNLDAWLRGRLRGVKPSLRVLSSELASYGITGVTDAGVANDVDMATAMIAAVERGEICQRVMLMGNDSLNEFEITDTDSVGIGPLKIYLREAELPSIEELTRRILRAHNAGRPIAAHCVTRVELVFLLSVLGDAGVMPGDRVEHASIADNSALEMLAALGVSVVTQPHFIAQRGDQYLLNVEETDIPWLYRGQGFITAGIGLAAGSDAPYGSCDPWFAMRAATQRRTSTGVLMTGREQLTAETAFGLYCGALDNPTSGYRPPLVGDNADLCLLKCSWRTALRELDSSNVKMTLRRGEIAFESNG